MSGEPHIVFNDVNARQGLFHRRALLFGGMATLGVLGLSTRLAKLQLLDNGRYRQLAASNQFNYRLVPPPRGRILDRDGVELASNRPTFRLLVSRDEVGGDVDPTLDAVSSVIAIPAERRKALMREFGQAGLDQHVEALLPRPDQPSSGIADGAPPVRPAQLAQHGHQ